MILCRHFFFLHPSYFYRNFFFPIPFNQYNFLLYYRNIFFLYFLSLHTLSFYIFTLSFIYLPSLSLQFNFTLRNPYNISLSLLDFFFLFTVWCRDMNSCYSSSICDISIFVFLSYSPQCQSWIGKFIYNRFLQCWFTFIN